MDEVILELLQEGHKWLEDKRESILFGTNDSTKDSTERSQKIKIFMSQNVIVKVTKCDTL
jgi:hypothetical protein